jgi:hypothetical protein
MNKWLATQSAPPAARTAVVGRFQKFIEAQEVVIQGPLLPQ